MGGDLLWHFFSFAALFSLGLHHLVCSSRSHLKSHHHHSARIHYPLPYTHHLLRHLPFYLSIIALLLSILLRPLLAAPSLFLPSLHLSSTLLLFLLPLLLPLPTDLLFLLLSLPFLLLSRLPQPSPDDDPLPLHSKISSISSVISASSALLSLALALSPRLFPAELALAASVALRGLWSLQSGLSLYVDAFIPSGCHRLLDGPTEVSTRCELRSSILRASQVLEVAFALHVVLVAALGVVVYAAVARASGMCVGRNWSYEALPTSGSTGSLGEITMEHVQMKALGKSSAQA